MTDLPNARDDFNRAANPQRDQDRKNQDHTLTPGGKLEEEAHKGASEEKRKEEKLRQWIQNNGPDQDPDRGPSHER